MTTGSAKQQSGNRDVFGGKQFEQIDYAGPTSYTNTGTQSTSGDGPISPSLFGFFNTILTPWGSGNIDTSGTYEVAWQSVNTGVTGWRLRWFVVSTGAEVANGVNLSAYTVKLAALGY
jgi:hypothetical protein